VEGKKKVRVVIKIFRFQKNFSACMKYEVLMAMMIMMFLWVLAPCRLAGSRQLFGET
jgi:hypothetical protein